MLRSKPHIKKIEKFNAKKKNLEKMPSRLKKQYEYQYFPVKQMINKLNINKQFIESINENTKILEIGSGSGRLADFLIRKTKLKSKNLDLLDNQFNKKDLPYIKSLIYKLYKKEKINLIKANMYEFKAKDKKYDKVLIPNAFFLYPKTQKQLIEFSKKIYKKYKDLNLKKENIEKIESLNIFLENIYKSLNKGAEIRVNYFYESIISDIKKTLEVNKIFNKFEFKTLNNTDKKDTSILIKLKR